MNQLSLVRDVVPQTEVLNGYIVLVKATNIFVLKIKQKLTKMP